MFGKRKKKTVIPTIHLLNQEKNPVFHGRSDELKFPERLIIQKSIEFFDDSEPCFLHRGAVASRLAGEINEALGQLEPGQTMQSSELDSSILTYLAEYPVYWIRRCEE